MSLSALIAACDRSLEWLSGDELNNMHWVVLTSSGDQGARLQIRARLNSLLRAAVTTAGASPITVAEVQQATRETMTKSLGVTAAMELVARLRTWAIAQKTQPAESSDERRLEPKTEGNPKDCATGPNPSPTYITLAEAASISAMNRGVISRAIDAGQLKSNGLKGRGRKVDAADFSLWQIRRAKGHERKESDQHIIGQIKKHVHD
jgi:hypothetical protein